MRKEEGRTGWDIPLVQIPEQAGRKPDEHGIS